MKDVAAVTDGDAGRPSRWRGLTAKQAAITLVIALVFGILSSVVELLIDWRTSRDEVRESMRDTLEMVRPSAVEAAYQLSGDLAGRVVSGLANFAMVRRAVLTDDYGSVLAEHDRPDSPDWLADRLFGDISSYSIPLIHSGGDTIKEVGRLDVQLAPHQVAARFLESASANAVVGMLRAAGIAAVVVLAFIGMVTRPLVRLSQQVGAVDPRRPGSGLLPDCPGHERDELGLLVQSFNRLLLAFQRGLDQRDEAERGLTALTLELEARVEQRTQALALAKEEIEQLNQRLKAENVRLGAELDVSRKIQQMILPTPDELSAISHLDIATFMEPAAEVGGDYYDILHDQGRVRIGIGDVTGHGLESGVVMLMTQSAVRTLVTSADNDMSRVLNVLNRTIYDNVQRMGSDKNLTLALLDYRPGGNGGGSLRVGGQHESVIVVRHGGRIELIDTIDLGMPIGLIDQVDEFLGETQVDLHPGDVVVLYTDGITEAVNQHDELYGLERLCEVVSAHWREPAETIKRMVIDDVMTHIGDQTIYDDLTLIVLKQR